MLQDSARSSSSIPRDRLKEYQASSASTALMWTIQKDVHSHTELSHSAAYTTLATAEHWELLHQGNEGGLKQGHLLATLFTS